MLFPLPLRGEAVLLRNEDEELKEESLLLFPELLELLPDLEEKGLILALPPPLLLSLKANGSELFLLSDEAETPFPEQGVRSGHRLNSFPFNNQIPFVKSGFLKTHSHSRASSMSLFFCSSGSSGQEKAESL